MTDYTHHQMGERKVKSVLTNFLVTSSACFLATNALSRTFLKISAARMGGAPSMSVVGSNTCPGSSHGLTHRGLGPAGRVLVLPASMEMMRRTQNKKGGSKDLRLRLIRPGSEKEEHSGDPTALWGISLVTIYPEYSRVHVSHSKCYPGESECPSGDSVTDPARGG